jgi:hypothetical protein
MRERQDKPDLFLQIRTANLLGMEWDMEQSRDTGLLARLRIAPKGQSDSLRDIGQSTPQRLLEEATPFRLNGDPKDEAQGRSGYLNGYRS